MIYIISDICHALKLLKQYIKDVFSSERFDLLKLIRHPQNQMNG